MENSCKSEQSCVRIQLSVTSLFTTYNIMSLHVPQYPCENTWIEVRTEDFRVDSIVECGE